MGAWVFTFPEELRRHIGMAQIGACRDLVLRVFRRWVAEVLSVDDVGYYVAFHPCGDQEPGRWKPHFHLGFSQLVVREGQFVNLPGFLPLESVEAMRRMFREELTELAMDVGEWTMPLEDGLVLANINYAYQKEQWKIYHRISYDGRPFPSFYQHIGKRGGLSQGDALVREYGLLRKPTALGKQWRKAVRAPEEEEADPATCACCSGPLALAGPVLPQSAHGMEEVAAWAVELDDDGTPVPKTGPPGGPGDLGLRPGAVEEAAARAKGGGFAWEERPGVWRLDTGKQLRHRDMVHARFPGGWAWVTVEPRPGRLILSGLMPAGVLHQGQRIRRCEAEPHTMLILNGGMAQKHYHPAAEVPWRKPTSSGGRP